MYDSVASCIADTAADCHRRPSFWAFATARTMRWNGALRISVFVVFCNFRTTRSATVPGRHFRFWPGARAFFEPAFFDFGALAVCFVRDMVESCGEQ